MQTKDLTPARWRFSTAVLLPVIVAMAVMAASVLGFVFWSAASVDERALERQRMMISSLLTWRRDRVIQDQSGIAIWDDAVRNTGMAFDFDWTHRNIGLWMHTFFQHNEAVVLDEANQPLYMMEDGQSVPTARFSEITAAILPLAEQVRAKISGGELEAYYRYRQPRPPTATDYALIEGQPAVIGVSPIVSDSRVLAQPLGTEALMVSIQLLNEAAASRITRDYLIEDGTFSTLPGGGNDRASYPVSNQDGAIVGYFEWRPERPGRLTLMQTVPVLLLSFGVGTFLVWLLLRQLRSSSAALEAGRRAAEHDAAHDPLTGLSNRADFDRQLARQVAEKRKSGVQVSLLMLDLDRFKQVNDTFGHPAGDSLIRAVGERIRVVLGPGAILARLGGDEFAIALVAQPGTIDIAALSDAIIEAIRHPFEINQFKAHVGVSIGIVNATGDATPSELLRKADIALYEAKSSGRNRAVIYEEHMNELLQLQHTIEAELREALRSKEQLEVNFQPLIDEKSRKVIGAEALARWHHPKYGQISPARFIPVAESTGQIEQLGEMILRRACELGASAPGRTIAVNISPTQLRNPGFAELVFDILHQTGMKPVDLELEITESILLDDEHVSAQNLRTFRAAGIHIALDDFGTGYSSLSYLKRYPVDRIKIDRSFVMLLSEGHVSVAITQAIVTLAHALDIEITAEGVETEKQATILGRMGCNTLQGFLFSPAVVPARIAEIFADPDNTIDRRRRVRIA